MKKVTYIFGAGASALAIPVVAEMPYRLRNFYQFLETDLSNQNGVCLDKTVLGILVNDVKWLFDQLIAGEEIVEGKKRLIPRHASVDTLAKKLSIRKDLNNLKKLKIVLSLFFAFEQTVRNVDLRYDSFFAAIVRKSVDELPKTIKVVSWNYDSQFELAFREFTGLTDIEENQGKLGMITKSFGSKNPPDGFAIYKINGSASFFDNQKLKQHITTRTDSSVENVNNIVGSYRAIMKKESDLETGLSFSWEDEAGAYGMRSVDLATSLTDTHILVVIGYSFPFFNREIDTMMIKDMNLQKVFIQDKSPDGVVERFKAIRPDINPIPIDNVDQFYLPNELSL